MNKKLILSKSILFIIIVAFIGLFKSIFGQENTLVGVTVITLALMIIKKKPSEKFIVSFLKILFMNVFLGLCSFLAYKSLILGLILNTTVMFIVAYVCSYNLNEGLYIPFGLQYMFMLNTPVDDKKFVIRLVALVFGALFSVTLQYTMNRNKNGSVNKFKLKDEIFKYNKNFTKKSLMFSYGVRMALVMGISTFIMEKIDLPEVRWIMYTVFSLTKPYKDNCNERIPKRVEGTLIGSIIFMVLFTIIESSVLRTVLLMVVGYTNTYITEYRKMIICVTISALGTVAIGQELFLITLERILFIIIGTIISKVINNYVLPFNIGKQAPI
ncbi:FUSC family protein [Clostridium sp. ATCC 25772]|uniref:FUSC family protein n=1 Tax=Clostridium sp. ATCC 25772 TaxID=1676991 RepID=UPI000782B5EE|nr:FUSC family protein [Clostridium sp. ATCC 25772]